MIIVKGRELLIPENERYLGTNYDTGMENRVFRIPRLSQSGTDLSDLKFNVNLIFNSEPLDIAELQKNVDDDYIYLTWTVTAAQVAVTGTVFVCVTGNDTNDTVKWSTFMAPFYTEKSLGEDVETEYKKVIAKVNQEIEEREAADAAIQESLTETAASLQSSIDSETSHRTASEASLQSSIDSETSHRTASEAEINTRIDNLVVAGGDDITEVVDARVGSGGIIYNTLKTRLDTEYSDFKHSLNLMFEEWNIWDEVWGTGYEFDPETGELKNQTAYRVYGLNKCKIEPGQYYYVHCGSTGFIDFFFWDASNNFISGGTIWSKKNGDIIKTPDDARWFSIETYLYGSKYLRNICVNKYTPNGVLKNGMYLPYVSNAFDNKPIIESIEKVKSTKLEKYGYTNTTINASYDVEWEPGDINVDNGKEVQSTSLLRSNYIPIYGQGIRLSITSEEGYSVGIRIYEQDYSEAYVGAVGQRAYPYTQPVVSGRYYRFIIKNDNSQAADLSWATHVKITVEPTYDVTQLRSEEIIRPDFDRFDLPSAVTGWQDFIVINDKILFFLSSSDGFGDADGKIYVVNKSDLSYVKTIYHNFGHVNAVDYDAENDILLTGSATDYVNDSEIYFIYAASDLLNIQDGDSALFSDFETTTISLLGLQNKYGVLSYVSACFGQKQANNNGRDIVINATVQQKWFIIRPDVTTNNGSIRYSTTYETIVFKSYTHTSISEIALDTPVCQGMVMYKGRLYSTTSHHSCNVAEWIFNISGQLTKRNYYADCGNNSNEGLAIIDGYLYAGNSVRGCLLKMLI